MKTTRRDLVLALAAASPVSAQAPAEPAKEDLLESARTQIRGNSKQLAAFKIDIAAEPAFQFKA